MTIVERAVEKARQAKDVAPGSAASAPFAAVKPGDADSILASRIDARGPLLSLDIQRLAAAGLTYSGQYEALKRNEYRLVWRQLAGILTSDPARGTPSGACMIAVTSSLAGEGKTYNTFNLARAIARQTGKAVLLVDADIARATLSAAFGVRERGVIEFLSGEASQLEPLVMPTSEPRLAFLPAGNRIEGVQDLMGDVRLHQLMSRLRAIAGGGVVLLDCPPVLLTDDAGHIATGVDRVVFVVRAGVTLADAVREGVERLGTKEKTLLLLNGWEPVRPSEKDYSSQYYDYYNEKH
jgi:protein-tyrosine kinase